MTRSAGIQEFAMSKERNAKKEVKKKPAMTMKEKKVAKKQKKASQSD